jgi:hypothetical protein
MHKHARKRASLRHRVIVLGRFQHLRRGGLLDRIPAQDAAVREIPFCLRLGWRCWRRLVELAIILDETKKLARKAGSVGAFKMLQRGADIIGDVTRRNIAMRRARAVGHPGAVGVELIGWIEFAGSDSAMIEPVQPKPIMTMSVAGRYVAIAAPLARCRCHGCAMDYAFRPSMLMGGWG